MLFIFFYLETATHLNTDVEEVIWYYSSTNTVVCFVPFFFFFFYLQGFVANTEKGTLCLKSSVMCSANGGLGKNDCYVNNKNIMTLTSKSSWSCTSAGWCLVQDLQGQERKQSDFCWPIMKRFNYGQFMEEIPAITLLKPTHCGCWDEHIWHQQEPSRTLAKEKNNYSVFLAFNTDFKSAVKSLPLSDLICAFPYGADEKLPQKIKQVGGMEA